MKRVVSIFSCFLVLFGLLAFSVGASAPTLCPDCGSSAKLVGSREEGMYIVYKYQCTNSACGHTFESKFLAGGGSTRGGGAGRGDSLPGYTSDGVANYTKDGLLTWRPAWPDNVLQYFRYWYTGTSSNSAFLASSSGAQNPDFGGFKVFPKMSNSVYSNRLLLNFYPHSNSGNSGKTFQYNALTSQNLSFTAPVSGFYSCNSLRSVYSLSGYSSVSLAAPDISASKRSMYFNITRRHYNAGDSIPVNWYVVPHVTALHSNSTIIYLEYIESIFYSPVFQVEPDTTYINKVTNITINNNTFNGNIYQDTENNLTYIYPQYSSVDDNGDTIIKICENPIIYNSTTNQYYTYDSVTNNYYYITYESSTEPTATPDPGTTPTPTPTPGGDVGDTSSLLDLLRNIKDSIVQGFADLTANIKLAIENLNINIKNYFDTKLPDISTGETATPSPQPSSTPTAAPSATPQPSPDVTATPAPSDSPTSTPSSSPSPLPTLSPTPPPGNSSDTSFTNPFKWLSDLLGDIFNGILKGLFKLFGSIFSFLLWLLSLPGQFVPWLPDGCVTALVAGAVVVTIIRLLKFILGR